MTDGADSKFDWVMLPETEDSRLFVELSSYGNDLAEAHHALATAISFRDSQQDDMAPYLVAFAAIAYCRTFFPSKVRKPLTAHIVIPDEHEVTHRLIASFRNTTVAHSQSDLATTYAIGAIDRSRNELSQIFGPTVSNTLPPALVDRFIELVMGADDLLTAAIEPVRKRLLQNLRGLDIPTAIADWPRPSVIDAMADEFNPRRKRRRYPTAHPMYWSLDGQPPE